MLWRGFYGSDLGGWLPEQPTLIQIANVIDTVADDARLGELFHPDRFSAEVRMNKI